LRVSKYCCTFEGEYRKEEFLPEETKFEAIPKIGEGYFYNNIVVEALPLIYIESVI